MVPVAMCIYVAQHHLEKPFRLFLLIKLLYRHGKTPLSAIEIKALSQLLGYADDRAVKEQIEQLKALKWIRLNKKTKVYLIKGFDALREDHHWTLRSGIVVYLDELHLIRAIVGAALYGHLYLSFWRKVRREKVVRTKGRTYQSFPGPFLFTDKRYAPIATTGIRQLYNISVSKASRLKNAARKAGYISVKKDLTSLPYPASDLKIIKKHWPEAQNLRAFNGQVVLQQVDLVCLEIRFRKRRKLKR